MSRLRPVATLAAVFLSAAPPAFADPQFSLLVLAMPSRYHYEYIPIARESFDKLSRLHDFDVEWTPQASVMEGDLSKYAAIVFLNSSGEELDDKQRRSVERYIRAGGNAVIVHRAIISAPGKWPWYEKLVGRSFKIHPMLQTAVVSKVDPTFPATFGLPEHWIWSDEWYELTNPHDVAVKVVLGVDETSYDPRRIWPGQVATGMGADHPVSWHHTFDGGRVFVTSLGHNAEVYRDSQYLAHLWGGIYWSATGLGIQKPR